MLDIILAAMRSRKITKKQLATQVGVSAQTVTNWFSIRSPRKISLEDFLKVCKVLKLEVSINPTQ